MSPMKSLTIDYPDTLPDILQETDSQFQDEAKWALALKLYELGRLPSGLAAQLVGVDRVSFLMKLREYNIPAINYPPDELAQDLANA